MGKTVVVGLRFTKDDIDRLDKAIKGTSSFPSRSEFIRYVVLVALDQVEGRG